MRVTILAHKHEDPESPLAEGPVLEIIRSVQSALQWLPAATLVGAKEATRKRTPPHSTSLRSMVTLAMSRLNRTRPPFAEMSICSAILAPLTAYVTRREDD
jgi:hypothetical protein